MSNQNLGNPFYTTLENELVSVRLDELSQMVHLDISDVDENGVRDGWDCYLTLEEARFLGGLLFGTSLNMEFPVVLEGDFVAGQE